MTYNPISFKSSPDIPDLPEDASLEEAIAHINRVSAEFTTLSKLLSFTANFDGYITTVTIPASGSLKVQHFLGIIPKYRIILKQEGNGVISDIPSEWNDKTITLVNNGVVDVTITILIARE